jgi:hypothetical protein
LGVEPPETSLETGVVGPQNPEPSTMGWRVAGTIVILTLAQAAYLAGCGSGGLDDGLVASHVKTFEGDDVEVKSCEKTGEAITNDDYGAKLDEVWRCDVKQPDGGLGFAESCYVVYNEFESGVVRGIRCAAAGPGCPAGGSGDDRTANGRFLGRVVDPTLVLEQERGNRARYRTVRVVVHHQAEDVRERCGYLNVRVPVVDDPLARAAERVEASGFDEPRYSFSYSLVGG